MRADQWILSDVDPWDVDPPRVSLRDLVQSSYDRVLAMEFALAGISQKPLDFRPEKILYGECRGW